MSLAIPPLQHKPSWHIQGYPYLLMIHNPCNTRKYTSTVIVPTNGRKYIDINLYKQRFTSRAFSPTDAQLDSLKNSFKFPLKLTLKSSYMFRCKTPSSGSALFELC